MDHTTAAPAGLKRLAAALHMHLGRGPRWLVRVYLAVLSVVSRNFLSRRNQQRVFNSVHGHPWPAIEFGPRSVVLGRHTEVRLVPHLGEFDEQALFTRHLVYEPATFGWLEREATNYDLIVEIGANAGIFTLFLDAQRRRRSDHDQVLVSFEPSPEAFRRLERNLALNGARASVHHAAVGEEAGQRTFYEPVGHLTNGSFVRDFAAQYGERIEETNVAVVAARDLEKWLAPSRRALIKADVEGFEPQLLVALAPLLERYRPDLLIEVMPSTAGPLEALEVLAPYDRYLIIDGGLQPEKTLRFEVGYFDWFLTARSRPERPTSESPTSAR